MNIHGLLRVLRSSDNNDFETAESEKRRLRKRQAKNLGKSRLPLNRMAYEKETSPEHFYSSEITMDMQSQLPTHHYQIRSNTAPQLDGLPPIITVKHSCLLIPMFIAAWWYWTRRKARAVVSELLHRSSQDNESELDDVPDDFSTW